MDYAGRSDSATVLSNGQVILPQLRFQQHIGSQWILFICDSQHKCQDARNFCSAGDSCRLDTADETFHHRIRSRPVHYRLISQSRALKVYLYLRMPSAEFRNGSLKI